MCGIFGAYSPGDAPLDRARITAMSRAIAHRGPDADGVWTKGGVTIGNRRLAVIDLSTASNQPLISDDGQIALVQNGEIFNYVEMRDELKALGARFHTKGDTEVILRAYEQWGPEFVRRLNGMFAIAIHDLREGCVWLYRDRLGVKPLYLATLTDGTRVFASEIKALLEAGITPRPDIDALAQFLALNYIPPPQTAFEGITHLPPAHMARIDSQSMKLSRYWSLDDVEVEADMDVDEAGKAILETLSDATRIRLRADAEYGAFLSGGIDSTSVVGFMRDHLPGDIRTYSIGFDDPRFDETRFAKLAAEKFNTIHRVEVAAPEITALWPRFIWHCDQPHGDVSFMPMDMVSQLAAREVKMVLTGDGGDELFGGYEKYLDLFPDGKTTHLGNGWEDRYARQSGLLKGDLPKEILRGDLEDAFRGADPYRALSAAIKSAENQDPINRVLRAETEVLLPGNNLVKPDRMAMANSLEARAPYLDYRMAELAFRIPGHLKLAGGETKAVLKRALAPMLGQELTYRDKQMFTVPIGEWFRGTLAEYCRGLLCDGRLGTRGLVEGRAVAAMLEAHIAGRSNFTRELRALMSLEIWFRLFIDADPVMRAQVTR